MLSVGQVGCERIERGDGGIRRDQTEGGASVTSERRARVSDVSGVAGAGDGTPEVRRYECARNHERDQTLTPPIGANPLNTEDRSGDQHGQDKGPVVVPNPV